MCRYYTAECSATGCSELASEKLRRKGRKCACVEDKVQVILNDRKEIVCADHQCLGRVMASGMYCSEHSEKEEETQDKIADDQEGVEISSKEEVEVLSPRMSQRQEMMLSVAPAQDNLDSEDDVDLSGAGDTIAPADDNDPGYVSAGTDDLDRKSDHETEAKVSATTKSIHPANTPTLVSSQSEYESESDAEVFGQLKAAPRQRYTEPLTTSSQMNYDSESDDETYHQIEAATSKRSLCRAD